MERLIGICLVTIVVLGGCWLYYWAERALERSNRKKLGQQMIAKAKWYGARLVRNIDHDICAVTSTVGFDDGLSIHNEKVENGQIKPWEPVVVYASPTFTFAGSKQTFRPIHTSVKRDLDSWVALVLKDVTGVHRNQVSREDFDAAVEEIMPRDTRLFVPYSGSANEKQFVFYGKQTLDDFGVMMSRIFRGFK